MQLALGPFSKRSALKGLIPHHHHPSGSGKIEACGREALEACHCENKAVVVLGVEIGLTRQGLRQIRYV